MKLRILISCILQAVTLVGCSKAPESPKPAAAAEHAHVAPHGGTLVELGEHAFSLEFVHDTAGGVLTAYVLDAHAENFVRVAAPALELTLGTAGQTQPLVLRAVANPATGETVGDTAQFEAQADWLKADTRLSGVVGAVDIHGAKFTHVAFVLQK